MIKYTFLFFFLWTISYIALCFTVTDRFVDVGSLSSMRFLWSRLPRKVDAHCKIIAENLNAQILPKRHLSEIAHHFLCIHPQLSAERDFHGLHLWLSCALSSKCCRTPSKFPVGSCDLGIGAGGHTEGELLWCGGSAEKWLEWRLSWK